MALVKSRVRWTHPINVDDFKFLTNKTALLPKITIPARARCISAAAMRRCSRTPIATSASSGTNGGSLHQGAGRAWRRPAAATCRSTKPPSPSSATRRAGGAGGAWRRLERTDRYLHRGHQPRICALRRRHCRSACICAGATAAGTGMPKAATKRSPSGCSTRSKSRSISSNTTLRAPAISRRCVRSQAQVDRARIGFLQDAGTGGQSGIARTRRGCCTARLA